MSATIGTIPISALIGVNPEVLPVGGSQLGLNCMFLTESTRSPIGVPLSFPAPAENVGAYFGLSSPEYAKALVYFAGFTGAQITPAAMLLMQYPATAVAAWLRGGSLLGMTLVQLQAFTGTITISVNGTPETSGTITLTGATSFSNAAAIIQAAFTTPVFTVTFDSTSNAFVFTSDTAGISSTIAFPTTDALTTGLGLTAATGAVLSQGAAATTPGVFMPQLVQLTQNFATFTTLFNPDGTTGLNVVKQAFQAWNNAQNNRFAYICWDRDIEATEQGNTENLGYILQQTKSSGCVLAYEPADYSIAAFLGGYAASLDTSQQNGRFTAAYRAQSGLTPGVTNQTIGANLMTNGYNFYGLYGNATSNEAALLQPGQITGPFAWFDSYICQIWMNNNMQIALFQLAQIVGTIPYNVYGKGLISQALIGDVPGSTGAGPINQAIWFGAIATGVELSSTQAAAVTAAAGVNAVAAIQAQGYYLQIGNATPAVRAVRGSPPISLWYTDGESIQTITLNSVEVQ